MMTHPLALAYGETMVRSFPLILVVGREPNHDSVSDKSIGQYNFAKHPKCGFWNIAFKTVGASNGLTTAQVKQRFNANQTSPIVFTDASPKGIINEVADKHAFRAALTSIEIAEHVNAIFGHQELVRRTRLAMLSGLEHPKYTEFKMLFKDRAVKENIQTIEVAFFYGTNYPKIKRQIAKEHVQIIQDVFEHYERVNTAHLKREDVA